MLTEFFGFIISLQTLTGIVIGVLSVFIYIYLKDRNTNNLTALEKKFKAYQLLKSNLNELLDTMASSKKVKMSVSRNLKKSVNNGLFVDEEDKDIVSEILEANTKYLAFGETVARTPYNNKELINDYHNFIYRIIERIDINLANTSKQMET